MSTSALRRLLQPLARRAERRLPSLTRLRHQETLPIHLGRRRIYILPTRYGLVMACLLMVMMLGALNYNNNAALLLTCTLGATCLASMLQSFRALHRLNLCAIHAAPVTAGDNITLHLSWQVEHRRRHALELRIDRITRHFSVAPKTRADVSLALPTNRRGWMPLPRMQLCCRWPYGLFRAWSWLAPAQRVLVYPRPEASGPPPPPRGNDAASASRRPVGDEWAGLREYRAGDSRRHIAWKASARAGELRVKTFDQPETDPTWQLSWGDATLADREARIARLARWVTEAATKGRTWSLQLPGQLIEADHGERHLSRCLRALAELP